MGVIKLGRGNMPNRFPQRPLLKLVVAPCIQDPIILGVTVR